MTQKAKHTPGRWEIYNCDEVRNEAGERIAHCHPQHAIDRDYTEDFANARLIAASPEMLQSLKEMLNILHYYTPDNGYIGEEKEAIARANAIIAKAEGK